MVGALKLAKSARHKNAAAARSPVLRDDSGADWFSDSASSTPRLMAADQRGWERWNTSSRFFVFRIEIPVARLRCALVGLLLPRRTPRVAARGVLAAALDWFFCS